MTESGILLAAADGDGDAMKTRSEGTSQEETFRGKSRAASRLALDVLGEVFTSLPSRSADPTAGIWLNCPCSDILLGPTDRRPASQLLRGVVDGPGPADLLRASLAPLVLCLRPNDVILAWLLLACERKVVVCGSNREHVMGACEALLSLLQPLHWVVSYVPCLPPDSVHIMNAPNPFLIGWMGTADEVLLETSTDPPAIVDLDAGDLVIDAEEKKQFRLPQELMQLLKDALELDHFRETAIAANEAAATASGFHLERTSRSHAPSLVSTQGIMDSGYGLDSKHPSFCKQSRTCLSALAETSILTSDENGSTSVPDEYTARQNQQEDDATRDGGSIGEAYLPVGVVTAIGRARPPSTRAKSLIHPVSGLDLYRASEQAQGLPPLSGINTDALFSVPTPSGHVYAIGLTDHSGEGQPLSRGASSDARVRQ